MSDEQQAGPLWSDDEIVSILRRRQHHLKLANSFSVITLIAAAELMRMVRDDLRQQLAECEQRLDDLQFAYDVRGGILAQYEEVIDELYLEKQRLAEARPEGTRWTPVDFVKLVDGLEIHVDNIALTIGKVDTALATHQWPEDGYEYMICQRTPGTSAQEVDDGTK